MKLTYTQTRVLNFLREYHVENGYMPTISDIAKKFECQRNNADMHVKALAQRGAITKIPRIARGLRFTPEGAALVGAARREVPPVMIGLPVREMRQMA